MRMWYVCGMARMPHDMLLAEPLVAQALAGRLDAAQARQLAGRDPELVALALLALARRIRRETRRHLPRAALRHSSK